jgi:hypothetical protein
MTSNKKGMKAEDMKEMPSDKFNLSIGRLDRELSVLVDIGRQYRDGSIDILNPSLDGADRQTLKHHAEDMILAGRKILKDLGCAEPQ